MLSCEDIGIQMILDGLFYCFFLEFLFMVSVMKYFGKCIDIIIQEYFFIFYYEKGNYIFLVFESIVLLFVLVDKL